MDLIPAGTELDLGTDWLYMHISLYILKEREKKNPHQVMKKATGAAGHNVAPKTKKDLSAYE